MTPRTNATTDSPHLSVRELADQTRVPEHHVALVLEQLCGTHLRSTDIDWTISNPLSRARLEQQMHSPERLTLYSSDL